MTKYVIGSGHKNICAAYLGFENQIYQERFEGTMEALREHGLEQCAKQFIFDIKDIQDSYMRIRKVLEGRDRPTALIAVSYTHLDVYKRQLYAQHSAFGEKGAVLLNDGEEMGDQVLLRYHNRFSKQGPAFSSADIEHTLCMDLLIIISGWRWTTMINWIIS